MASTPSSSTGLADCEVTTLVTNHAAFGYLAAAYGLTQAAISGLAPDTEPTPTGSPSSSTSCIATGVTTVFTEDLVSPKVAETLADEAGVQTAVLDTLEGLTPDEVAAGEDYGSVMRRNLETLRGGLDCSLSRPADRSPGLAVAGRRRLVRLRPRVPCSRTSRSTWRPASSSRSSGRTVPASRRCSRCCWGR